MKRTLLLAPVVLSLLSLPLFASSPKGAADQNTGHAVQQDPDFALQDLEGKVVHFSDFRGKVIVLNFWATWCPPCRVEIPWFIELQKQYGPQGLQFLGISMDDGDQSVVASFAAKMGINYPILVGAGEVSAIEALPTTLYFGRDGKLLKFAPGLMDRDEVERTIRRALTGSAPDDPEPPADLDLQPVASLQRGGFSVASRHQASSLPPGAVASSGAGLGF